MRYELTEKEHKSRAQIRYLGYLCGKFPKQYSMRIRKSYSTIKYELWENYKDLHGFWDCYEVSSFEIDNKPNNFKWPWMEKTEKGIFENNGANRYDND